MSKTQRGLRVEAGRANKQPKEVMKMEEKKIKIADGSNVGLDLRQAIRKDGIFLLQVSDSDCHLPDIISSLQTTRASLELKVKKLIELREQA